MAQYPFCKKLTKEKRAFFLNQFLPLSASEELFSLFHVNTNTLQVSGESFLFISISKTQKSYTAASNLD